MPSAFAAISIGIAVYLLGRRWFNVRASIWAACLWLTFPLVTHWGRLARGDMVMTCLILWGILLAVYSADSQKLRVSKLLGFCSCLIVSAAMLSKGFQAIFFFTVAVCTMWRAHRGRWLPPVSFLITAGAMFFTTVAAWSIATELHNPGYIKLLLGYQFGKGLIEHRAPIYFYAYQLFLYTLPWGIFAFGSVYFVIRRMKQNGYSFWGIPLTFLLVCLLALTLIPNKRAHYLLPILPMWALFIGAFLDRASTKVLFRDNMNPEEDLNKSANHWLFLRPLQVCLTIIVTCSTIAPAIFMIMRPYGRTAVIMICASVTLLMVYGLLMIHRGQTTIAITTLIIATVVVTILSNPVMIRYYWKEDPEVTAAYNIVQKIPPKVPVAEYDIHSPLLFFIMNRHVTFLQDTDSLCAYLKKPGKRYIILKSTEVNMAKHMCLRPLNEIGTWLFDKKIMHITLLALT